MRYLALLFVSIFTLQSAFAQGPETEICMVTVDETFTYNKIIWEANSQTSTSPIDSMRIYRKNFIGGYDLIGKVEYNGSDEFADMVANPNTQSHTYKIQGVDENGTVGPMSDSATTIHLSLVEDLQNNSLTLEWTDYEGSASFSFYQCWDIEIPGVSKVNINNTNNMNTTSWTYPNLTLGTEYVIVVDTDENTTTCSSGTRANYNNTRSNRSTISFGGQASSVTEHNLKNISLYPNPSNGIFQLDFSSTVKDKVDIQVYDLSGKLVYQHNPIITMGSVSIKMDLSMLQEGVYSVVIDNGYKAIKKITIN